MDSKSSFNGDIAEIPDICVDNFTKSNRKAYFLSHCHTDHTVGLYSTTFLSNLLKTNAVIYTSEASAAIVEFEKYRLKKFIRSLKLGRTTITIPGDKKNGTLETYLTVTLIPAGHCLGSVMFLFKTTTKTILYTGDFRISNNSVSRYGQLHMNEKPIKIDTMYVDTSFQNDLHDSFPKRSETVRYVIDEIQQWLMKSDNNRVALHAPAKYGYEFVYNAIWESLHERVYVNSKLHQLYSKFPDKIIGVTDNEPETKIHNCCNRNEHINHKQCIPQSDDYNFLYVYFSAMKWENYDIEQTGIDVYYKRADVYNKTTDVCNKRIDVCFATHCSRSELIYFVNYFSPKKVVGFKQPYNPNICDKIYEDVYVPSSKKIRRPMLNETVNDKGRKKIDDNSLREMFG